jgi:hypothetical protein
MADFKMKMAASKIAINGVEHQSWGFNEIKTNKR